MKKSVLNLYLLLIAGSLSLASCGSNESTSSTATSDSTTTAMAQTPAPSMDPAPVATAPAADANTDAQWVADVVAANMAEIDAHTAAQTHAMTSDVKMHAKHMLADHKKMGEEMTAYAKKKNISLPSAPPADKAKMLEDMNANNKGKDWDKAYVDAQVNDHKETIAKFESGEKTVTDPELKDMITKTIPTLKMHLQMVEDAQSKMK